MSKEPSKPSPDADAVEADRELDEELDDTFPASDPPKVTRVPRQSQFIGGDDKEADDKDGR